MTAVLIGLGLVAVCIGSGFIGWVARGERVDREHVGRCLDCDALKRRGGLVVVHGRLPGRAVQARDRGELC